MSSSPAGLSKNWDFFFDPNLELTNYLEQRVTQSLLHKDVISLCVAWYVRHRSQSQHGS
ncbi:DUF2026 domain-containing protein [Pantoea sp. Ap-967]|nr:DUF2026 domain-containing protein [Pantoea sp. Ap-967]